MDLYHNIKKNKSKYDIMTSSISTLNLRNCHGIYAIEVKYSYFTIIEYQCILYLMNMN